jgi:hypothetical protein
MSRLPTDISDGIDPVVPTAEDAQVHEGVVVVVGIKS